MTVEPNQAVPKAIAPPKTPPFTALFTRPGPEKAPVERKSPESKPVRFTDWALI